MGKAKAGAEERGGRLVKIETKNEHDFLVRAAAGRRLWIGALGPGGSKGYKWTDGTTVEYFPGLKYSAGIKEFDQALTLDSSGRWNDLNTKHGRKTSGFIVEWEAGK